VRVLIAYRSRYGATESCARALAAKISSETVLHDLRVRSTPPVGDFDVVLIGGSIYGGRIQREVEPFCDRERQKLLSRNVGLFICCFYQGERGLAELASAFPPWLAAHAFARELFGGQLSLEKLSLLDRLLVRGLVRPAHDIRAIRPEAIERLAAHVNSLRDRR
jgi:menaquinone-dependent protoporphyrinogen oxidase